MRLRPSKFVVLLLLACAVQLGEVYALRLVTGHSLQNTTIRVSSSACLTQIAQRGHKATRPAQQFGLGPRASAIERTPRQMTHPASASAAIASFTGLLRA